MISFIVIGYEEERNLHRTFSSIFKSVKKLNIQPDQFEIIYVEKPHIESGLGVFCILERLC